MRSINDPDFLKMLRCPETRQQLTIADAAVLQSLNTRIAAGHVRNRGGGKVAQPCEAGLVREDGRYLYPIREAIPVMLIAESLPLDA